MEFVLASESWVVENVGAATLLDAGKDQRPRRKLVRMMWHRCASIWPWLAIVREGSGDGVVLKADVYRPVCRIGR
ncbi:hypothetical protein ACFTS5_02215 [Nocardia sp. NPDC056952]|uniref:hypothetical protein n=1 Tax=Nocardia sp. NPDC056952 TaxID=3345979 RepID=UPI0036300D8E